MLKKRLDGFLYAGRDTFTKVITELQASGKPLTYHNHKINLKLNQVKGDSGFEAYVRMDAYSGHVQQMREKLAQKYGIQEIAKPSTRDAWFSFSFKPITIAADELVKKINALRVPRSSCM